MARDYGLSRPVIRRYRPVIRSTKYRGTASALRPALCAAALCTPAALHCTVHPLGAPLAPLAPLALPLCQWHKDEWANRMGSRLQAGLPTHLHQKRQSTMRTAAGPKARSRARKGSMQAEPSSSAYVPQTPETALRKAGGQGSDTGAARTYGRGLGAACPCMRLVTLRRCWRQEGPHHNVFGRNVNATDSRAH